jgi:signal transduction histidine kinase
LTESERTVVDVDRVVREVVADCRRRFDGADISYEGTVQATATAVPAVSRAVTELVENAVKHSRDDPTAVAEIGTEGAVVDLSVSVRGEDVYVTVSDEGPGLPDHEANILTEEREISPVYHASGMGLWLVRWVIKRSRGEVDIVENGSTGATVEIRLPRTETAPDRPTGDRQNRPG